MGEKYYEFVDLDKDECFHGLGKTLGGVLRNESLRFDNEIGRGELVRKSLNEGLSIRKWNFSVFQNLTMRKLAPAPGDERKFVLLYILKPAVFLLKNVKKKIRISGYRNNMFLTNDIMMDFNVNPKQPFYAFDISFTA